MEQNVQLSVTALALEKIEEFMKARVPSPAGIKIFVYSDGGNGVNYAMNFVDAIAEADVTCCINEVTFAMDAGSAFFLDHMTLDYVSVEGAQGFTFKSPCTGKVCANCDGSCGRYA